MKKLILISLCILLHAITFAQYELFGGGGSSLSSGSSRLKNIKAYFTSDVFLPSLIQKNDLKYSASIGDYGSQALIDHHLAWSPFNNIGIKYNFRHNIDINSPKLNESRFLIETQHHAVAVGAYKFIKRNTISSYHKLKKEFKNKGKKYPIRESGFLLTGYLGYTHGKIHGKKLIQGTSMANNLFATSNTVKLDLSMLYLGTNGFNFGTNITIGNLRYSDVYLAVLDNEELERTNTVLNKNKNEIQAITFLAEYELGFFSIYLKSNITLGSSTQISSIKSIANNGHGIGLKFNLDALQQRINFTK